MHSGDEACARAAGCVRTFLVAELSLRLSSDSTTFLPASGLLRVVVTASVSTGVLVDAPSQLFEEGGDLLVHLIRGSEIGEGAGGGAPHAVTATDPKLAPLRSQG